MKTAPTKRSGWFAVRSNPLSALPQWTMRKTRSRPSSSSSASASAAVTSAPYSSGDSGRSERPLPRGSNVRTLKWRERYGTCPFQKREWLIAQGGRKSIVSGASPKSS